MKALVFNDFHWGVNDSNSFFLNYQKRTNRWIFEEARKQGVNTIIINGDLFHRPQAIYFQTLAFFQENFPVDEFKYYILVGNHDTVFKNSNHLNSVSMLLQHENVTIIVNEPEEHEIGGRLCLFVPWINKTNYDISLEKIKNSRASVLFSHLELSGFEMIRGFVCEKGQIPIFALNHYDIVYSGHYHTPSRKGNIIYLGSPLEHNWSDCGDDKYVSIHNFEDNTFELVKNPEQFFIKIKIDETSDLEKLPDVDFVANKPVKIILDIPRTVEIEKYIAKIEESAYKLNVIDNNILMTEKVDVKIEKVGVNELWDDYLEVLEMDEDDKENVDRIFKKSYLEAVRAENF